MVDENMKIDVETTPKPKTVSKAKAAPKTKATPVAETAPKTEAEPFDFASLTETYRKMAETNMTKAEENFKMVKSASDEAAKALEEAMDIAKKDGAELSKKAFDAVYGNLTTSMSHVEKLMSVKSMSEIIEVQSTYMREQSDALSEQVKSLQEASVELSEKVSAPVKAYAEKSLEQFKSA